MATASIVMATVALLISLSKFAWEVWNRRASLKVCSWGSGAAKVQVGDGAASYVIWVVTLFNQSDVANVVLRSQLTVERGHEVCEYRSADLDYDARGRMRCTPPLLGGQTDEQPNGFVLREGVTPFSAPLTLPLELPPHAAKTGYLAYFVTPDLMGAAAVDCRLVVKGINGSPISTSVNTRDADWWPSDFYEEWTFRSAN